MKKSFILKNSKTVLLAVGLMIAASCSKKEVHVNEDLKISGGAKTGAVMAAADALAARPRPVKSNGTFVTSSGALLRGVAISSDIGVVPSETDIAKIKNLGMNTIHLYAECSSCGPVTGKVAAVDAVINAAENLGLYVILTIGNGGENGSFNLNFVNAFWNFYAPRYKDRTHVMYEIQNEPFSWGPPYDTNTLNMEKNTFNLIRAQAPNTPILLMSYAVPVNYQAAINEINGLGLNLSNAGIAIHGYGITDTEFSNTITGLKNAGFAVVVTEPARNGQNVNINTTTIFENLGVSYAHFLSVANVVSNNAYLKTPVDASPLRWKPDYGTWPLTSTEKIVHLTKSNATGFAVDGGNGGANGQAIYLFARNTNNVNQKWIEIDRGGGFYSYKKLNTNYCMDGGNGGANAQAVVCWTCDAANQNQQWQKISTGGTNYRLQKRNSSGFSIDGGNGGANSQPLYLWASSSSNQNQQWTFLTY